MGSSVEQCHLDFLFLPSPSIKNQRDKAAKNRHKFRSRDVIIF